MDDQLRHYKAKLEYEIDPWDLNEALGRGDKILLVDTRSPEAYRRSHIPGAINIPHRTMGTATTAHLDRGALIVTYCDGIRCNGSTKGALNMLELGFRVKELIGGLDCWRYDGYPVDGLETGEPAGLRLLVIQTRSESGRTDLAHFRRHGVVLEAAHGPVPSLGIIALPPAGEPQALGRKLPNNVTGGNVV